MARNGATGTQDLGWSRKQTQEGRGDEKGETVYTEYLTVSKIVSILEVKIRQASNTAPRVQKNTGSTRDAVALRRCRDQAENSNLYSGSSTWQGALTMVAVPVCQVDCCSAGRLSRLSAWHVLLTSATFNRQYADEPQCELKGTYGIPSTVSTQTTKLRSDMTLPIVLNFQTFAQCLFFMLI